GKSGGSAKEGRGCRAQSTGHGTPDARDRPLQESRGAPGSRRARAAKADGQHQSVSGQGPLRPRCPGTRRVEGIVDRDTGGLETEREEARSESRQATETREGRS